MINIKILYLVLVNLLLLASGCTKTEFTPPAIGEAIPYKNPGYKRLDSILMDSKEKLFYEVFRKSNQKDLFTGRNRFTVLQPSDKAMEKVGYSLEKINKMTVEAADSLICFYTLDQEIQAESIKDMRGSIRGFSLLKNPNWTFSLNPSFAIGNRTYQYIHYLIVEAGNLFDNGILVGEISKAIPASNGYLYPIDTMIPVPTKEVATIIENDPRFNMFLGVMRQYDEYYDNVFRKFYFEFTGKDPGAFSNESARNYYSRLRFRINTYVQLRTLFIPTNEAFMAAGFNSVQEVLDWTKRAKWLEIDRAAYSFLGGPIPTDTLFNYCYNWGRDNFPTDESFGKAPVPIVFVFYQNELRNDLIGDILINNLTDKFQYVMPYTYGKDEKGRVTVQIKGSKYPAATIVESINTPEGPIHVIDRLLIPKDFKMK